MLPTRNPDLPVGPKAMLCSLGLSKGCRPCLQHDGSEWERERDFLRAQRMGLMVRRATNLLPWTHHSFVLNDVAPGSPEPQLATYCPGFPASLPLPAGQTAALPQSRHRWRNGNRGCSGRGGDMLLPSWNCRVPRGGKGYVLSVSTAFSVQR